MPIDTGNVLPLNPLAAVLVAHTTMIPSYLLPVMAHASAIDSKEDIKRNQFDLNHLKETLVRHHLELKSSHPDALENLYTNMMKVI